MARKRMLDPSIWTDEGMAELTPRQQLLYIGLISNADDEGRLKGSAAGLRLMLPTVFTSASAADVEADLVAVQAAMRQLHRYEADGRVYLAFLNYRTWQQIQRPTPSKLPAPKDGTPYTSVQITEDSLSTHGAFSPNRKEEKGIEENSLSPTEREAPATPVAPPAPIEAAIVPAGRTITIHEPANGTAEHPALWDAFTDVFGEARGKTEKQRRGEACKRSREAHATPDEIRAAAEHWPNVMGDATMTELGIVANLGKLLHGPQVNGRSKGVTVGLHHQATQKAALRASPEDELAAAMRGKR